MSKGSKPGERRGGRQKGTPNKAKANRDLAIRIAGIEPKQFLLNGLGFYQGLIEAEIEKGADADLTALREAFTAGREFAKDAAPYCHSRMPQLTELTGLGGGPIETETRVIDDTEAARRIAFALTKGAQVPTQH